MLSNDLLQNVQERMGIHQDAYIPRSLVELEPESPIQVLHTSEEKLYSRNILKSRLSQ